MPCDNFYDRVISSRPEFVSIGRSKYLFVVLKKSNLLNFKIFKSFKNVTRL